MKKNEVEVNTIVYCDGDTPLLNAINLMIEKQTFVIGVKRGKRITKKVLTIRDILKELSRRRTSLWTILNESISKLAKNPRYVIRKLTTHEIGNLIKSMRSYRPIFILREGYPYGFLLVDNLLKLFSNYKSLWYNIISEYSLPNEPLLSPNTTLKSCIRKLLECNSFVAVVYRKGKVLGMIEAYRVLESLVSKNCMKHLARGEDDYFYHTTCSTIMNRDYDFVYEDEDIEDMYDFLEEYGYLLVLTKTKRLSKFLSNGTAFNTLKKILRMV